MEKESSRTAYIILAILVAVLNILLGFSIVDWQFWTLFVILGGTGGIIIEKFKL
jgi:fatty acid desaturase